ncbi:unnamed protein product [Dovyalis caffra]|uniref:Uncharacterized protein n=1 Tax=Dovyalis caffra TaxID=77055 RepID=A0AAV1RK52_9ROSI|nr:unnamed protein product [Dovyalis caffra]
MASSQIEIASSSPFGCVLRDHNRRERYNRESNARATAAAFQKNLKGLAREMVSTIERQSEKAGLLMTSLRKSSPVQQKYQDSENSTCQSENSSVNKNRGASSLVQIWEARLHQSEACLTRSHSLNNSGRSSVCSQTETASSSAEERSKQSDISDSTIKEDTFVDCGLVKSAPTSIRFRNTDAGEPEKVKIVDIIRRLTSDANDHDQQSNSAGDCLSRERRNSSGSDPTEQKVLSQVVNSPKIRGRQAFNDLLLQMEQERHRELGSLGERKAVSRFPQRGRIQSLLRLRFLHRGMAFEDQQRPRSSQSATSSSSDRSQHGSTIMHLRERFSAGMEQATTQSDSATPRSTTEMVNSSVDTYTSIQNELTADSHQQQTSTGTEQESEPQVENSASDTREVQEKVHGETCAGSGVTWQETTLQVENFDSPESSETTLPLNDWDENEMEEEEEYFEQTNYDWFSDIARPRSYWEDQRKARYEEKLNASSDNDEIRQLLERRTVSSFLTSDLRDRIDQLMVSRAQRQVSQEEEELDKDSQERMGQLMLSYFQRHSHPFGSQEEEREQEQELDGGSGLGETVEEECISEEEGSTTSHQYMEATDYFDQSSPSQHSPYPFRSWNYNDDQEVVDGCEQAQTTPLHLPPPSQSSNQDRRFSSSTSHSSIVSFFTIQFEVNFSQVLK